MPGRDVCTCATEVKVLTGLKLGVGVGVGVGGGAGAGVVAVAWSVVAGLGWGESCYLCGEAVALVPTCRERGSSGRSCN